jgi:biotin carboxyl carrier protein
VVSYDGHLLEYEQGDGRRCRCRLSAAGPRRYVHTLDGEAVLLEEPRFADASAQTVEGGCVAPMPGAVVKVLVAQGDRVEAGATLVVIEAMKMEHVIKAPADGVVQDLSVREGDHVAADQLLVALKATP